MWFYYCADDTHGTPIMLKAKSMDIDPVELIEKNRIKHINDFREFEINFDYYGSTHSNTNRNLCESFFTKLLEKGFIKKKSVDQFYCEQDAMFLPDRFIRGECPNCGAENQYGDNCDVCAAVL